MSRPVIAALAGVVLVGIAACGNGTNGAGSGPTLIHVGGSGGSGETKVVTAEAGKPGALGEQVQDGDLAFVVTGVADAGAVGDQSNPALQATANGIYVVVHLEILNTSKNVHTFLGDTQTLRDAKGSEYSPDTMAGLLARNAEQLDPGAELAPGAQKKSILVYDIPQGVVPKELVLHTERNSRGATVLLG